MVAILLVHRLQTWGVPPQRLQLIELPGLRVEDMHYEVDVVHQHPSSRPKSLHMFRTLSGLLQLVDDVIRNRLDLNVGGPGRDDEEVRRGGDSAKVKDRHFPGLQLERQFGGDRSLDEQVNQAGYLRLTTCEPLVTHMGNRVPDDASSMPVAPAQRSNHLVDLPIIRKPLLWFYDAIFKLYHR